MGKHHIHKQRVVAPSQPKPRIVLKIGTSTLVNGKTKHLAVGRISRVVEICRSLRDKGYDTVVVSSGAIGCGSMRLGIKHRPQQLSKKQALAAVGQSRLMSFYDDLFKSVGLTSAQILLSYGNIDNRRQYDNAKNCFEELFRYGCVPIVNENDTTAVDEIRVGDNDTLSAFVANMISAKMLILVTDVDGLYDRHPSDPDSRRLPLVDNVDVLNVDIGEAGSAFGTGGMATKLRAAKISVACGVTVVILKNDHLENIPDVLEGSTDYGTTFTSSTVKNVPHRKRWMLANKSLGKLYLDQGAVEAVRGKMGLFPIGLDRVEGKFAFRDVVSLYDVKTRTEFGKGMVNFGSADCRKLIRSKTENIPEILGFTPASKYVMGRENIVLFDPSKSPYKVHRWRGADFDRYRKM